MQKIQQIQKDKEGTDQGAKLSPGPTGTLEHVVVDVACLAMMQTRASCSNLNLHRVSC